MVQKEKSKTSLPKQMTQKQLLEHISKGFQGINQNLFEIGLRLAVVEGTKDSQSQLLKQNKNTTSSSKIEEDFLLTGGISGFDNRKENQEHFMVSLSRLMQEHKVFRVDVNLNKTF